MSELAEFSKLAVTLEQWRSNIVFIGGWAFRLYEYEPRAYKPEHKPIFTQDADVAYAHQAVLEGDIKSALGGRVSRQSRTSQAGSSRLQCDTRWARAAMGFMRNS